MSKPTLPAERETYNNRLNKVLDQNEIDFGPAGYTADSLVNAISGLNTGRDRMYASQFLRTQPFGQNYPELEAMYTENWIAKKGINLVAQDMTRKWVKFDSDKLSPEEIKQIKREEKRLQLRIETTNALRWSRLYGGSVIMPILNGAMGENLMEPLDISKVKIGDLESLNVIEARYIFPTTMVEWDPTSPAYLMPQYYTLAGANSTYVHHSRVIRFEGDPLPKKEKQTHRYWGQSVLESARRTLVEAFTSSGLISSMLNEANIDVISIENLAGLLSMGGNEFNSPSNNLQERFQTFSRLKSMFNISLIDSKETYGNRQINFSNLDKIMEMFYINAAGAFNMPVTKLLGVSPAGLNATGEHDLRNYYDWISAEQENTLEDPLTILYQLISQNLWGSVKEDLEFEFVSLWQEDPTEEATRQKTQADTDQIYYDMGILAAWKIAEELKKRGTYQFSQEEIAELKAEEEEANAEIGNKFLNKAELPPDETTPPQDEKAKE